MECSAQYWATAKEKGTYATEIKQMRKRKTLNGLGQVCVHGVALLQGSSMVCTRGVPVQRRIGLGIIVFTASPFGR